QIVSRDFLNETRNVNMRRTGVGAGRIVAVQAAIGLDQRFLRAQGRQLLSESFSRRFVHARQPLLAEQCEPDFVASELRKTLRIPRIPRTMHNRREIALREARVPTAPPQFPEPDSLARADSRRLHIRIRRPAGTSRPGLANDAAQE